MRRALVARWACRPVYADTREACERYAQFLLQEARLQGEPVGIDLEWNVSRTGPGRTALVQVALANARRESRVRTLLGSADAESRQGVVFLLHVARFLPLGATLPDPLRELIEAPDLPKVGLNVGVDMARLGRDFGLQTAGAVEIRDVVARKTEGERGIRKWSLAKLVGDQLGLEVDKSLQQSDWEHPLTEQQVHYAALDAWLPLQIWLQVKDQPDIEPPKPEKQKKARASAAGPEWDVLDEPGRARYELLKDWRDRRSRELRVPSYIIMQNRTLLEIATLSAPSAEDLTQVWGLGPVKHRQFAKEIVQVMGSADAHA